MTAQEYEDRWEVRIKFASFDKGGYLYADAHEEYDTLFQGPPQGWSVVDGDPVQTRQEGQRRSWLLRHGRQEIAAVEHETGVEFLIAVGVEVAAAAIIGLTIWAWKRWQHSRSPKVAAGQKAAHSVTQKVEPSLLLELVTDRFPDGSRRVTRRLEIRGPVNEGEVEAALRTLNS